MLRANTEMELASCSRAVVLFHVEVYSEQVGGRTCNMIGRNLQLPTHRMKLVMFICSEWCSLNCG